MDLPGGTLTFLFTDIEGSTRLWEREPLAMRATVARHDALLVRTVEKYAGRVVKTTGDGMLAVFESAHEAAQAAVAIQRTLRDEPWAASIGQLRVRAALHTGTAELREGDYFGTAVNRTARLLSAGHGGQTLLSQSTQELLQDHLPTETQLLYLGEYRLRDLTRPERIYQLNASDLPADFPPLRTRSLRPSNLPAELSSFIGRERELSELEHLLGSARLVTLTGPGGAGKTRLSQRVAASIAGIYADGVYFVALAATSDPALVPNTVAKALGVVEQPGRPLVESLERYVAEKRMLLVLDSYEHVLAAASLAAELLAAGPQLSVLATSREALRLNGEHEFPVPPLSAPDPSGAGSVDDLAAYESVALFVERTAAASPKFRLTADNAQAVAGICARLDGLPLAIELAAARIKLFTPQQILERLESRLGLLTRGSRDLPARQRTLRDTIDWSYNLLDDDERRLFTRLGVFSGGRSLDAVEAVCAPGLATEALDGLESLLNKSLLNQEEGPAGEPRFTMLETIHEYAQERLSQGGEEQQIRKRHLDYFLSLAEEMEPGYWREGQLLLLARTESEIENLRSAFNWALEDDNLEAAARLVSSITYYFAYGDRLIEGYLWVSRVLGHKEAIADQYRLRLLVAAAWLSWADDDLSQSIRLAEENLLLARKMNDKRSEAWALLQLAISLIDQPEALNEAARRAETGLAIYRELRDEPGIAQALNIRGELARAAGDYDRAQEVYEECMAVSRKIGDVIRQSLMLENMTFLANHQGDYVRGRELALNVIRQWANIGRRQAVCIGLAGLAGSLGKLGEPEKAAQLLGASTARLAEIGIDFQPGDQHEVASYTAEVRAQLDKATFEAAWAEGQAMKLDSAIAYALEDDEAVG
jgi:predicted ATPase/class 3 adenylate cyclase